MSRRFVIPAGIADQLARMPEMVPPELRRAITAGAVLLRKGGGSSKKIRNQLTGRILPCCYDDCTNDASTDYEIHVPHEAPRWVDLNGTREALVYAFCSDTCKAAYIRKARGE